MWLIVNRFKKPNLEPNISIKFDCKPIQSFRLSNNKKHFSKLHPVTDFQFCLKSFDLCYFVCFWNKISLSKLFETINEEKLFEKKNSSNLVEVWFSKRWNLTDDPIEKKNISTVKQFSYEIKYNVQLFMWIARSTRKYTHIFMIKKNVFISF